MSGEVEYDAAFRRDSALVVQQLLETEKEFRNFLFSLIPFPGSNNPKSFQSERTSLSRATAGNNQSYAEQWAAANKAIVSKPLFVSKETKDFSALSNDASKAAVLAKDSKTQVQDTYVRQSAPQGTFYRSSEPNMSSSPQVIRNSNAVTTPIAPVLKKSLPAPGVRNDTEKPRTTPLNSLIRSSNSPPNSNRVSFADSVEEHPIHYSDTSVMRPESLERRLFEHPNVRKSNYSETRYATPPDQKRYAPSAQRPWLREQTIQALSSSAAYAKRPSHAGVPLSQLSSLSPPVDSRPSPQRQTLMV